MILFNGLKSLIAVPIALLGFMLLFQVSAGAGAILAGVLVAAFGFYVNRWKAEDDIHTGERRMVKERNGFFFIPLQYWGIAIALLGIVGIARGA